MEREEDEDLEYEDIDLNEREENEEDTTEEIIEEDDYNDNFTLADFGFMSMLGIFIIAIIITIFSMIKRTFTKANVKIGEKFQMGIETKEDSKKS